MKLKKLSFRNFKSYSNILAEISFDDTSSLNFVVGENGTGKTSVAECITYLLYGKLDDFTASDIPNRINKSFYGKIEVDCDGHNIIIERGLNPSLFKASIDGQDVDTAGKNNVQAMLEENYFHIPYSVFRSVVIIELGDVHSLLDLGAADKRNIIDKICGFTIYNNYGKFIKEDLKMLGNDISINDGSIRSLNSNLVQYNSQIEEIKGNISSQEEIDELMEQVRKAEELKSNNDQMISKIREAREKLKTTNIQRVGEFNNLKNKICEIDKKIKLLDGGKCPTCGSSLDTEDFQKERKKLIETKEEYENQMKLISKMGQETQSKLLALDKKEESYKDSNNRSRLVDLKSDLKYKQSMKEKSVTPLENLKVNLTNDLENMEREKKILEEKKSILDVLNGMFSDGGIKKYVAEQYIPIINTLMSGMMGYMNLNYTVTFDGNFDATIKQNGYIVKYRTLSKGQKAKVDFAAIISFVKFLKLQFGELNLLFLDELFAHVDINGINDMIEILRGLSKEMSLNIYLIHHAKLEGVMFDNILETKMTDGFSRIEYVQEGKY